MKTFTVLVLCIFALCCCQDPEAEADAVSEGDQKCGKSKTRSPHGEYLANIDKVCKEKVKVTADDMKSVMEMRMKGKCANDPSEQAKCFMKCVLVEKKRIKEDGTPTLEDKQKNYTLAAQKVGECNQIKADASCASGYQVATCLREARRIARGF